MTSENVAESISDAVDQFQKAHRHGLKSWANAYAAKLHWLRLVMERVQKRERKELREALKGSADKGEE